MYIISKGLIVLMAAYILRTYDSQEEALGSVIESVRA
jgi:hypothetical protein